MRGHVVLSLKQLAGNSCEVLENVLCPAVIVSPVSVMHRICVLAGAIVSAAHALISHETFKAIATVSLFSRRLLIHFTN